MDGSLGQGPVRGTCACALPLAQVGGQNIPHGKQIFSFLLP